MSAGPASGPPVRIGILGAGFVADLYLRALEHVRGHEVTVVSGNGPDRAKALADRFGVPAAVTGVRDLVRREDVDLVLVAVPHDLHVEAVTAAAEAGKAVVCTKPLGRDAREAQACLAAVQRAGVWHGYAETEVFAPGIVKARQLVDAGAIGRVTWVRAREAHGNPHPHARDERRMGGGPLRGLGCHCVAIGRWFLDGAQPAEVMAWGDRLVRDDVTAEDSAVMLVRFDDGRMLQVEVGWTHVAGLDVRNEIHGSHGWIGTDETGSTGVVGFTGRPAGYVVEKAGSDQGWIIPVPDEPWTYGYHAELAHFVDCFRRGVEPRQTLRDGVIDNAVIDAGYRSMASRGWEAVTLPA
ncbi:dehydrogenase [Acrocarpospora pleiomorpha]|uniref:Dehydrogenase n=1 Tax=Acrocarpospora pleiomorpha TaxID=90975 RepID=A0A5M3XDN8_9ACTN|nr:Gfo/Idh/MocA family oxidoreductase [Acrocarpospora pleiomorpha]GES19727.1 dehydrogenase [Acrocarpospora pleiomorpha]